MTLKHTHAHTHCAQPLALDTPALLAVPASVIFHFLHTRVIQPTAKTRREWGRDGGYGGLFGGALLQVAIWIRSGLGATRLTAAAEDKVESKRKKEVDDEEEENRSQVAECAAALIERHASASTAHIGKTRKARVQLLRKAPRRGGREMEGRFFFSFHFTLNSCNVLTGPT